MEQCGGMALVSWLLMLVLSACFLVQVREQVGKFLRRETTLSAEYVDDDDGDLRFPTVSLCLHEGYHRGRMEAMGLDPEEWVLHRPVTGGETDLQTSKDPWSNSTKEELKDQWRRSIFSASEMISQVVQIDLSTKERNHVLNLSPSGQANYSSDSFVIEEVESLVFGRCAVVRSLRSAGAGGTSAVLIIYTRWG